MIYIVGEAEELLPDRSFINSSTVEQCLDYFRDHSIIALDTETQGRDPHSKKILSLQLGDGLNQYVIDCRKVDILLFKELIESKTMIVHNSKFDYKFLKAAGINMENIYDTMLAECVIYCGYEKYGYSLQNLVSRYLGILLDKETRGDFFKLTSQPFTLKQILYAAKDVQHLHAIKEQQEKMIAKYKLEACLNLENNVVKALADIEYNGMILDSNEWMGLYYSNLEKLRKVEIALDRILTSEAFFLLQIKESPNLFSDEFTRLLNINYNSPVQALSIINKILGALRCPPVSSSDDRVLSKLKNLHPFFKLLQEQRELAKRVSTYGKEFLRAINKHTQRVHTDFWQVLVTGRVSSGNKETGAPNLQNIPAQTNGETDNSFRQCFKARPGFKWVSADYSQQELMLMVDISGEEELVDILNAGKDLHCYMGSIMFKREIDPKKDKPIRTKVKTMNFGELN